MQAHPSFRRVSCRFLSRTSVLIAILGILLCGCSDSGDDHSPSVVPPSGFDRVPDISEFKEVPTARVGGQLLHPVQATAWNSHGDPLVSDGRLDWSSLPGISTSTGLVISSPAPPTEVWLTKIRKLDDSGAPDERSLDSPVLCSQNHTSDCVITRINDSEVSVTVDDDGGESVIYGTVQGMWVTSKGEEYVSWVLKVSAT